MAGKMQIALVIPGFGVAMAQLTQLTGGMNRVARAQQQITGPASRLQRAQQLMGMAQTPTQRFDAAINLQRAQSAYNRAANPGGGAGQQLMSLLKSTRVGIGGGGFSLMPLIGQLMELPGPLKLLAVGIAGTAMVIKAFVDGVQLTIARLSELTGAGARSGGSPGEIAALTSMGMPADQIAGRSAALRHLLGSNPMAMGAGMRAGLGMRQMIDPRMPGAEQDSARGLQQVIEYLQAIPDKAQQLQEARRLEMDDMLQFIRISDSVVAARKKDAEALNDFLGTHPDLDKTVNDFQAEWKRLNDNLKTGVMEFLEPIIKDLTAGLHFAADEVRNFSQNFQGFLDLLAVGVETLQHGPKAGADLAAKLAAQHAKAAQGQQDAANKQQMAADKMARAMQPGTFGGGPRARDAIVQGMFNPGLDQFAFRMGAFGY